MKAIVARTFGEPSALSIEDWPAPIPGPGEVLVRIRAAGVGFVDTLVIAGKYQLKPDLPFVPGAEFAGEVMEVGEDVADLTPGTLVCGGGFGGAFAEMITIPAKNLIAIPAGASLAQAAVLRATYFTVWYGLVNRANLRPGETLLVLGGGGAIGVACCQIGRHLGATVIAHGSTPEKRAFALANGAHHAVGGSAVELRNQAKDLTAGRGVDVVADPVSGDFAEAAFRALTWNGRHLVIGFASGQIHKMPMNLPLLKGAAILGVDARQFGINEPEAARQARAAITDLFVAGTLRPQIALELPLDRYVDALNMASDRATLGRVVLRI